MSKPIVVANMPCPGWIDDRFLALPGITDRLYICSGDILGGDVIELEVSLDPKIPFTAYTVFDVETTVDFNDDQSPSPFNPNNKIVMTGLLGPNLNDPGGDIVGSIARHDEDTIFLWSSKEEKLPIVLIGHNLKFDLSWCVKANLYNIGDLAKYGAWDTMIAHYILSGQKDKFPSLEVAAARYGLTGKGDLIKVNLAKGINVDKIPANDLTEYLASDLVLTYAVAARQIAEATKCGKVSLILAQSQAMLAITAIECAGMAISDDSFTEVANMARNAITASNENFKLQTYFVDTHGSKDLSWNEVNSARNVDPAKTSLVQAIIYGGEYEIEIEKQSVTKKGKPKTKIIRKMLKFTPPSGIIIPENLRKQTENGKPVSDAVLDFVLNNPAVKPRMKLLVQSVKDYRLASKILRTYITGIVKAYQSCDKLVHGKIHQVSTDTGRTSSSEPNLQNYPENCAYPLKSIFVSRFGNDGVIMEADFRQLEVVILAHLVGPGPLRDAINRGKDIHDMTGVQVWPGTILSDDQRRIVKTINFGLIYGGSAGTLSQQAGVSPATAIMCIIKFYDLFPDVREWQLRTVGAAEAAVSSSIYVGHSDSGVPIRGGDVITLESGRSFYMEQEDVPFGPKGRISLRPTKCKNYPVQGLATGDIVPLILGILFRRLYSRKHLVGKMEIINTVHDSFLLDVHKDVLSEVKGIVLDTMERTPEYVEKYFGFKFELPIRAKIKVGPNWNDLKEI